MKILVDEKIYPGWRPSDADWVMDGLGTCAISTRTLGIKGARLLPASCKARGSAACIEIHLLLS